jgi:hypothetical protein
LCIAGLPDTAGEKSAWRVDMGGDGSLRNAGAPAQPRAPWRSGLAPLPAVVR